MELMNGIDSCKITVCYGIKCNKEYYLLGYNAVWAVEIQPTFRRNILWRAA
jgi:hypothetical protein